jgi:NADH-quinone oxidoreductase subunit G
MTSVAPDQVVHTDTPVVKKAQEGVLEFLLANHPLDCPVCDKGGECPLQDQAFSHGPGESRFVEEKRHFEKPIPISDLVYLDRERCILCDRCTRFASEVAGDPLISFTHRGNETQVLTFPDEPFASYFSGNTVQICPVGALTARPYRFKARPWDLQQTESTCTTCAVGCRIVVQSSEDHLLRYQGVDSDPVNWGWLCDKGRFGWEAIESAERLGTPMVRRGDELAPASWSEALDTFADSIRDASHAGGPSSVAILGGARGTNEDAFAWARLAREVIGTANLDAQLGDGLDPAVFDLPSATIDEACAASTIVLLGADLKEELPVLYLRVRDAAERRRTRILEIGPMDTGLTPYAWKTVRYVPGEQEAAVHEALADAAVAEQLARGPVVAIVGRANLAEPPWWTVAALRELATVEGIRLLPALRRGNVRGAIAAGLTPGEGGADATGILEAAASGRIGCLVLLGADPLTDFPDAALARRAMAGAGTVLAVDTFLTPSSSVARVVLPAAGFGEKAGTTTNLEGRVTVLHQKVNPPGTSHPDWVIAADIARRLGGDLGVTTIDELHDQLVATVPAFSTVPRDVLAKVRDGALLAPSGDGILDRGDHPRPATRNAYEVRLVVSRKLYDRGTALTASPSLAGLAQPARIHMHPLDLDRLGAVRGTRLKVSSERTSVVLEAEPDGGVPRGLAWIPFNRGSADGRPGPDRPRPESPGPERPRAESPAGELIDSTAPAIDLRVENL